MTNCTLAMIVRDEAHNLPACLESVKGLFRSTVIVDTGSTDDTIAIARSFGATVHSFPWCDDFSAARNFGLDRITSGSVFRMDADDRLPADQRWTLGQLLKSIRADDPKCFVFRVASNHHTGDTITSDEIRLWPTSAGLRFHSSIHERVRPEEDAPDVPLYQSGVRLEHNGYSTFAMEQAKLRRNLAILEQVLHSPPVDPLIYFDAARTHAGLGDPDGRALALFEDFFNTRKPSHTLAGRVAHRRIVRMHLVAGDGQAAVLAAQRGLREYPDDQVLTAAIASLMASCGEYDLAREGYERAAVLCRTTRMDSGIATNFPDQINAALATLRKVTNGSSPTRNAGSRADTGPGPGTDTDGYTPRGPAPGRTAVG